MSFASPKQRQLPKTATSKAKLLPKKINAEKDPIACEIDIAYGCLNLIGQIGSQNLVSIQQ
jgi:hypothetical protein